MKHIHTEGPGPILKSRFARGLLPLMAALLACALAAPEARAAAPADFAKKMTLTPSTSALAKIGESTFVNLPVLVRLPAEASALLQSANGTDLFFTDENDASLPFEVDTFDPAGETLVWVKVPSLSSATELTAYFGGAANEDNVPAAVWTNYAGVWHMNEASGTVADATGHGLTASVMGNAANSVAVAGAVGNGRQTATAAAKGYLSVPNYDRFGLGNTFTMSGWVKMTACTGYPRLFSRKANYGDANGWEMEMSSGSMANFTDVLDNNAPQLKYDFITGDKYIDLLAGLIERLRPDIAVGRLAASVPPRYLAVPGWGVKATALSALLEARLRERDTWQGRYIT